MEPYTFHYLKAHADRLPAVIEHFVYHDMDFRFWDGELRGVQMTESYDDDYPAQIDLEIWDDHTKSSTHLRYRLHTHHAIYPMWRGDPNSFNKLWQFRTPIIAWLDSLKEADRDRTQKRTATIKEELMAATWSPKRVAILFEQPGGLEAY